MTSPRNDEYQNVAGISVGNALYDFVTSKALPGSGVDAEAFWQGFSAIITELAPKNRELIERRAELQARIDTWHLEHAGPIDAEQYRQFLTEIGYLVPEGDDFSITTSRVDPEISTISGPQLVVPITNARYALNAANARLGSLYDALYGTDVMGSEPNPGPFDTQRGAQVIEWVREFLDQTVPLDGASHSDVDAYLLDGESLVAMVGDTAHRLADPGWFVGIQGNADAPQAILLRQNHLGVIIRIDREHPIGSTDKAGVADVVLEAAVTAIMDCEDSVACVDAADKALAYSNWLGLMTGDLSATLEKGGRSIERTLNEDEVFVTPAGQSVQQAARALLLVRNVGHLMTTSAVLDGDGNEVPEGIVDATITALCAVHDLNKPTDAALRNSRTGSIYVVKPKMHGPDEVAFADEVFSRVESLLGLAENTIKIGVMDEERRTTVNLKECIRAVKDRLCFINTGFLDRTGDEIHYFDARRSYGA